MRKVQPESPSNSMQPKEITEEEEFQFLLRNLKEEAFWERKYRNKEEGWEDDESDESDEYQPNVDPEILTKVLNQPAKSAQQAHEQQESKGKLTSSIPDSADAVNNVSEEMTELHASNKIRYAHDDHDQVKDPRQAQQAADALNSVLEEMLPALNKICSEHRVDHEILTKVFDNLKNSITQETLIQLAKPAQQQERKGKLTRSIPDSVDAVNNVSEEMTELSASKKIRYAHHDVNNVSEEMTELSASKKIRYAHHDEEIRNKVSKEI